MGIAEKLLALAAPRQDENPELVKLAAFFDRMKREGVVVVRRYDLPQMDTIGRSRYQGANLQAVQTPTNSDGD